MNNLQKQEDCSAGPNPHRSPLNLLSGGTGTAAGTRFVVFGQQQQQQQQQ